MKPSVVTGLTVYEQDELASNERVISKGLRTFAEVGRALVAIRDGRLYREQHATFEDYCNTRWGFKKSQAYRLMESAEVVANLSPMGEVPTSERQARPLAKLAPAAQPAAWESAQHKAAAEGVPVAARHVEEAVSDATERCATCGHPRSEHTAGKWDCTHRDQHAEGIVLVPCKCVVFEAAAEGYEFDSDDEPEDHPEGGSGAEGDADESPESPAEEDPDADADTDDDTDTDADWQEWLNLCALTSKAINGLLAAPCGLSHTSAAAKHLRTLADRLDTSANSMECVQ